MDGAKMAHGVSLCMYVYACVGLCVCLRRNARMADDVIMYTCMYVCVYMYVCLYVCVCVYIYIYIYIYIHNFYKM